MKNRDFRTVWGVNSAEGEEITEEIPPVQSVSGNGDDLAAEPAMLADGGVEAYAVGDYITYNGIRYCVTGDDEVEVAYNASYYLDPLVIPPTIVSGDKTYRVTRVGAGAFEDNGWLRSITLPDSVTSIGDKAFRKSFIASINIPANLKSIGDSAFYECHITGDIQFPDGLTDIGESAFQKCKLLTGVSMTNSVTNLGKSAFRECEKLENVTLSNRITRIEEFAFTDCSSMLSIRLPDDLKSIGQYAFCDCRALRGIELPDGTTTIEEYAFHNCTSLSRVKATDNIKSIGVGAFGLCYAFQNFDVTISSDFSGPPELSRSAFEGYNNPCIRFFREDGKRLGGRVLDDVRNAYKNDDRDKNVNDELWWGLQIDPAPYRFEINYHLDGFEPGVLDTIGYSNRTLRLPVPEKPGFTFDGWYWNADYSGKKEPAGADYFCPSDHLDFYGRWIPDALSAYKVLVNVKKNDVLWSDHNRTFALTKDSGATFVTDLDAVEAGVEAYTLYDVTGLSADEFQTKGVNTGVTVTVANADVTATVDYYTATFYDYDAVAGETAYGADTDQRPQTVLKTVGRVVAPADPTKEGYTFDKWVTAPGGDEAFSFETKEIGPETKIYASWIKNTAPAYAVTIHVKKDGEEWSGHGRSFALRADGGSFVTDLTQVAGSTTYSIYDTTGLTPDSYESGAVDTGVDVTVANADVTATVDYYTATFYDYDVAAGEVAYGADTDQRPQTVLKTVGRVTVPATNPKKEGYTFDKWVTAPGGDEKFSFALPITPTTKIYAKWTKNTAPAYAVTIHVKKDTNEWSGHGRSFALRADGGGFITDLTQVAGSTTYSIYDITGIAPDSYESDAVDTGVDVTVANADATATVDYYTATFYDYDAVTGEIAYGADTDQRPQTVLKTVGRVAVPAPNPTKEGYTFDKWVTTPGGNEAFSFASPITPTTKIYASWIKKTEEQLHITASAEGGGTISPVGDTPVTKGGEQTFTITPDEGNRIKTVTVDDDNDVTAELADHIARARADAKYYTFTNVVKNHTIHAVFENDGSNPGGGGGDNPNPGGGGDNPNPGGGGGDNPNPGGGGDNSNPGGSGGSGDNPNTDGGSGGSGDNPNTDGDGSTGNTQVTVMSETASPQVGKDSAGNAVPAQSQNAGGQKNAADGHAVSATGQTADGKGTAANGTEPKTGDTSYLEVYATLAMIAGLTWLLLCFMDEARGMSEREKEVFVAAFIRWGKKGGAFRKCCAMAAIFCLLAYYHTIGKRVGRNALPESLFL